MKLRTVMSVALMAALAACGALPNGQAPTVAPVAGPVTGQQAALPEGVPSDGQVYQTGNTFRLMAIEELPIVGVTASSSSANFPPSRMADGDLATQWVDGGYRNATSWAAVELAANATIGSVAIKTGPSPAGTTYDVQVSSHGTSWTTVLTNQTNTTWNEEVKNLPAGVTGKYVRIFWRNSSTNPQPHFAIFELSANGTASTTPSSPVPSPGSTATPPASPTPPPPNGTAQKLTPFTLTSTSTYSGLSPDRAVDGSQSSQWASGGYRNAEDWLLLQYDGTYRFDRVAIKTGALPAGVTYQIESSTDGNTWTPLSGQLTNTTWNMESKAVSGQGRLLRVRFTNNPSAPTARFTVFELEVYGAIVSAGGPSPVIPFAVGPGEQSNPKAAFNSTVGENFVVWEENPGGSNTTVRAQRISQEGKYIGNPITLMTGVAFFRDVVYNPTTNEYVVCFETGQRRFSIQRFSAAGAAIGAPMEAPGATGNDFYGYGRIAYNAARNEYLTVCRYVPYSNGNSPSIRAQRFNASAQPVGQPIDIIGPDLTEVRVAASATSDRYLITYPEYESGGGYSLYARVILGDGTVLPVSERLGPGLSNEIAYNWKSNEFLVTWGGSVNGEDVILGRRFQGDGLPIGEAITLATDGERTYFPNIAYNGRTDTYMLTYDRNDGDPNIFARRLDSTARPVGDSIPVVTEGSFQFFPNIVFNYATNRFLITWEDARGNGQSHDDSLEVYGRFVE